MSKICVILGYDKVELWGVSRNSSFLLLQKDCSSVRDVIELCIFQNRKKPISELKVFLDHPELDHRIEKLPLIKKKLQKSLLNQRASKQLQYAERNWINEEIEFVAQSNHYFLVGSLPSEISDAFSAWTHANGILHKGIYSLPQHIASCVKAQNSSRDLKGSIKSLNILGAKYLFAYDGLDNFLFYIRVESEDELEVSLEQLELFVEQEFSLVLDTPSQSIQTFDLSIGDVVKKLYYYRAKRSNDFTSRKERTKYELKLLKIRLLPVLICMLIFSILQLTTKIQERDNLALEVKMLEFQNQSLKQKEIDLKRIEYEVDLYEPAIKYKNDRLTDDLSREIRSTVASLYKDICFAMPFKLELDSISLKYQESNSLIHVMALGKVISNEVDLKKNINTFFGGIQKRGWSISKREYKLVRPNKSSDDLSKGFSMDFKISR